jgi:large subunit ribosomal protein L30
MTKIAVIRLRGNVKVDKGIKDTLDMLRLYNKNYCAVFESTPQTLGMMKKVKDFVTYGEIDDNTFNELVEKRGQLFEGREKDSKGKIDYSRRYLEVNGKKYKKYFRLSPPKGGFERKGIKKSFRIGGALGYRKDKINELIKKMI